MKIITPRQEEVLKKLAATYTGVLYRPIHTLELLEKKGLVTAECGGWKLTDKGGEWIACE